MDSSDGFGDSSPSLPEEYRKAEKSIAFWTLRHVVGKSHSAFHAPVNGTAVFCRTSSRPTPGANSARTRPSGPTSNTARSVMIRLTTPRPVSGRVHSGRILESPFLRSEEHTSELQSLMRTSYAV